MSTIKPTRRDGLAVLLFVILVGGASVHFELNERLYGLTRRLEDLQLDELPFVLLAVSLGLSWYAMRRVREVAREAAARRVAEARLQGALLDLRRLASERLAGQEQERKAIARDLHDDLGQYLTALRLDASMLTADLPPAELKERTQSLTAGIQIMHGRIRDLISRLRPVALDELGLEAALEHFIGLWQSRTPACTLRLLFDPELDELDEATALTAYRIVQEGVVNALRHAEAQRINVIVRKTSHADARSTATVIVEDDGTGCGIDGPRPGHGLRGMRERIESADGTLRFRPGHPQGLILEADLPILGGNTSPPGSGFSH